MVAGGDIFPYSTQTKRFSVIVALTFLVLTCGGTVSSYLTVSTLTMPKPAALWSLGSCSGYGYNLQLSYNIIRNRHVQPPMAQMEDRDTHQGEPVVFLWQPQSLRFG